MTFLNRVFDWLDSGRRRKEDASGFQEWVRAGARHSHPALLQVFEGMHDQASTSSAAKVIRVGSLVVQSGGILVQDPSYVTEDDWREQCFDETVPAGNFPVDVAVLNDEVAAVRLLILHSQIAFIVPAWTIGWRRHVLERREIPFFPVDSATAALFSVESAAAFRQAAESGDQAVHTHEYVSDVGSESCWQETKFADGSNMFCGRSGRGDGSYTCYFGKSKDDTIAAMYIDFGLVGVPRRVPLSN